MGSTTPSGTDRQPSVGLDLTTHGRCATELVVRTIESAHKRSPRSRVFLHLKTNGRRVAGRFSPGVDVEIVGDEGRAKTAVFACSEASPTGGDGFVELEKRGT